MSWIKDQAAKAKNIQLTQADIDAAKTTPASAPKTAPGQMMHLQATVISQKQEIEQLRSALKNGHSSKLPVARLHEVPGRRRKLSDEEFSELEANLLAYPLANPVTVEARPDGDWDIVTGNNRVDIYRRNGREEIDALIVQLDPALVERVAFFANLLSPSLSDFEKYWNFKKLQEGTELTRQDIAETAGLSKSHISRIFAFDGLPEAAKALLAERPERLGSHAASKLAIATSEGKADEVTAAIARLISDSTFTQDSAVKAVTSKPKTQTSVLAPLVVRVGKKKFCEISARNGNIGVRISDATEDAEGWAKEIQSFIEAKLNERRQ
ncbi:chromosome partitioning protein ParB [Robbsia andropogonis]|uniref:Chromosome partitioning protein ParB n=1 Tax=Robbsia andropogonis TaxID=28092 RepID=A0A0F5JTG9_9BURK|nr:ParB N-terminal domain-containing protein [Robbsia andropogonis]KKB60950.1 chromosome partitioning protein ParB [Robbsia andropogonis]